MRYVFVFFSRTVIGVSSDYFAILLSPIGLSNGSNCILCEVEQNHYSLYLRDAHIPSNYIFFPVAPNICVSSSGTCVVSPFRRLEF